MNLQVTSVKNIESGSNLAASSSPLTEFSSRPEPRSKLGAMIRAYIDSSASESDFGEDLDSEDEVELLGDGIVRDTPEKAAWREAKR